MDFVLDFYPKKFLTRSYNRSEPVLVVDKTPKMTDISVGSRVIEVHRRTHKEWYKTGTVIWTSRYPRTYVRFNSGAERWVPLEELRLEKRPRFCTTSAWGRSRALIGSILKSGIKLSNERPVVVVAVFEFLFSVIVKNGPIKALHFVEYLKKKNSNLKQATFSIMRGDYKNKEVINRFKSLMSRWVEKYLFFMSLFITFLIQELDENVPR